MNIFTTAFAIVSLSVSIASAQSFSSPESVEFDPNDGTYFIANTGNGTIVKLSPNGTLQNYATGIPSGPHGLELVADTLYVCDGSNIRMLNRSTGALIASVPMGATFLNGITHRGDNLYITDFSAKKIHRFNMLSRQHNIFCSTIGSKTPNGIIYDDIDDRIVYCCWGSNAPIYAINPNDSTVTFLGGTALGNCDGITMNCSGDFYVSSWSPNRVTKFTHLLTSPTTFISTGLSSPADIYYNRLQDTLYVPNSGSGNNVSKKEDVSCTVSLADLGRESSATMFPNPSKDIIHFRDLKKERTCHIYNMMGKVVLEAVVSPTQTQINIHDLAPGLYCVRFENEVIDLVESCFVLVKE